MHISSPHGRRAHRLVAIAIATASLAVLAGCSTAGPKPADSSAPLVSPKVTLSDATQASFVNVKYGPIADGKTYGVPMTIKDFTEFDSNQTATQAVLAGKAQIVGTSLMGTLAAQEQGADLVTFCPYVNQDDLLLVGRNGVTSLSQLFKAGTRVAVDSPGGAADETLNAMLLSKGIKKTTKDIPNIDVLESASLRQAAFAANNVDVAIMHSTQYEQIKGGIPGATIIATLFKDVPHFIKNTYAAPKSWLDKNLDTAAAFCAAVLTGNKKLSSDRSVYLKAVKDYVDEPPAASDLDTLWTDAKDYAFWPSDSRGGLSDATLKFMAKVGVASGVITTAPSVSEMLDPRPLEMAQKLIADKSGK